jgi:hypothetical protein
MLKNQLRSNGLTSQWTIQSVTPSIYALNHTQTVLRNTNLNRGTSLYVVRCQGNVRLPLWFAANSSFTAKTNINLNCGTLKRQNQHVVYQSEKRSISFLPLPFQVMNCRTDEMVVRLNLRAYNIHNNKGHILIMPNRHDDSIYVF